jgi:hypothetical protein
VAVIVAVPALVLNRRPQYLTVSEVWENAQALNGTQIRIRGQAVLRGPSVDTMMFLYGGCSVADDPDAHHTGAALSIYDMDAPVAGDYGLEYAYGGNSESSEQNRLRNSLPHVTLSKDVFQCKGDDCELNCGPFAPEAAPAFEFVGILRLDIQAEGTRLFLDALDLSASRQLVDEEWRPIPETTVTYYFP